MLKREKLYYLAHPLTTGENTIEQNRADEKLIYYQIVSKYPDAKIIRPLTLIPTGLDNDIAIAKCLNLLSAADGIILSPGWEMSDGCCQEKGFCRENDKEVLIYQGLLVEYENAG